MTLTEIQAWLETNKDQAEVKTYLEGLSKITLEGAESFAQTEDGKKWLAKNNDSFFSKGLDTWKKNNLDTLLQSEVDKEIKKRFPDKDPKDVELEKIKAQLLKIESEKQREVLLNKALKIADDKKLPKDILDYFIADNEENTIKNLESLEGVFQKHLTTMMDEKLKSGGYTPPAGGGNPNNSDFKEGMGMDEYIAMREKQGFK